MSRSKVDLPQPDGPTMETKLPASIMRSSGPSAWVVCSPLPKVLLTPASAIIGAPR